MAEYTVFDNATKREITFEWNDPNPPTDADLEEVFAAAAQQPTGKKMFSNAPVSTMGIASEAGKASAARGKRFLQDTAVDAVKGVVGLGESAVGVADLVTGNLAGEGLAAVGYDPKKTDEILSSAYSEERQRANAEVQGAGGFMDTLGSLVDNPSVAFGSIVQSAPLSLGGAAAARSVAVRLLARAGITPGTAAATRFFADPKVQGTLLAAAAGTEGAMTAGSIQEQGRQEGREWSDTVLPAVAAGATTGAISIATSKIPGFKDAEVAAATSGMAGEAAGGLLAAGKEIAKSMFKEGVLEELPQSAQEQVFTNLALGKPWDEGVGAAAAQGMVAGMGQGGGMTTVSEALNRKDAIRARLDKMRKKPAVEVPETGINDPTVSVEDAIAAANAEVSGQPAEWDQANRERLLKTLGGESEQAAAEPGARGSLDVVDPAQALADPMLREIEAAQLTADPFAEYPLSRSIIQPGTQPGTGGEITIEAGYRQKKVEPNRPILNDEQQAIYDTFQRNPNPVSRAAWEEVQANLADPTLAEEMAKGREGRPGPLGDQDIELSTNVEVKPTESLEQQAGTDRAPLAPAQTDSAVTGPSPVAQVNAPAQPLPAPRAFSPKGDEPAAAPLKIDTPLSSVQQEFIRGKVKTLGSLAAVQKQYQDETAPVDQYARQYAEQLFKPFEQQADVQAGTLAKTLEQAGITPDNPAYTAILDERRKRERAPDPQTGFISKEHFEPTMERAWSEHSRGRDFTYSEIDLRNLGGMNAKLGTSGADVHIKAISKIISEEVIAEIPQAQIFRKGGDEFGVVAPGASVETVNNALAKAADRVKMYAQENGLDQIPHAKGKPTPGIGIEYGTADFKDHDSLAGVRRAADVAVEEAKNVNVRKAEKAGAVAPGGQTGRIEQGAEGVKPGREKAAGTGARQAAAARVTAESRKVNRQKDDIAVAISKLGGLDIVEAQREWGNVVKDSRKALANHVLKQTRRFGAVFKNGGKPLDKMRESLVGQGYLSEGADIQGLYELIEAATRGEMAVSTENAQESELEREAREFEERAIAGMTEEEKHAHDDIMDLLDADETVSPADTSFDFGYNVEGYEFEGLDEEGNQGAAGETQPGIEGKSDRPGEADDEAAAAERTDDAGGWRQGVAVQGDRAVPTIGGVQRQGGRRASTSDLMDGFTPEPAGLFDATATATVRAADSPVKIEDFGEKIGGARKDYGAKFDYAKTLDVAAEPFSKTWPEPDYLKMIAEGTDPDRVSLVRALRDEIPDKPRKSWKLKPWVELVKNLREHAELALEGNSPALYRTLDKLEDSNSAAARIRGRVELYQAVGHDVSLRGVTLSRNHWTLWHGQKDVTLWQVQKDQKATAFGNMPQDLGSAETKAGAIEAFKQKIGELQPSGAKPIKFEIYQYRGKKEYVIGKKAGSNYIDLETLPTVQAARDYLKANQAELEKKLASMKALPSERREENSPRVGVDRRDGLDVTPEAFQESFGFRGVEFGNYVEGPKRQQNLNETFDALHDLADLLGVPSKALSLNGELGLAFGARGHGGKRAFAAHYESDKVVINLTKERGAGSLAHEWFHAADSYFSRAHGYPKGFITDRPIKFGPQDATRQELLDAFKGVARALEITGLKARSRELDKTRTKDYWSTGIEMHARAFENYVINKMADQGKSNDYLANIKSVSEYADALLLGFMDGKTVNDMYPYLLPNEVEKVSGAFDNLFEVMQTKVTEKGVALFEEELRYNDSRANKTHSISSVSPIGEGTDRPGRADGVREQLAFFTPSGEPTPEARQVVEVARQVKTFTKTARVITGHIRSGLTSVTSPQDLAHVMAGLRKKTVENFVIVVTAADGRIVGVIDQTTGTVNQSLVHPSLVLGASSLLDGAENVYLVHNHPTGDPTFSTEDRSITNRIYEAGRDTGLTVKGIMAIGSRTATFFDPEYQDTTGPFPIPAMPRKQQLPVEGARAFTRRPAADAPRLTSPDQIPGILEAAGIEGEGVALLDGKNRVVGFVPMSSNDMFLLRTGDKDTGAGLLTRTIREVNAVAMVAISTRWAPAQNLGSYGDALGVRLLDIYNPEDGNSAASLGFNTTNGATWFSRAGKPQIDEGTGLPLNADGTVTVYHHTSKVRAEVIRKTGRLKAQAEPDVYVTTRKETDTGYGDTAVAVNVDPALLQIDDEFPNGRTGYRLNVGKPGGSIAVKVADAPQTETPEFKRGYDGQFDPANSDIRFDRARPANAANAAKVQNVLADFTSDIENAPPWEAVQSETDLPELVQYEINSLNASGAVRGVFTAGKIYIVADNLNAADEAEAVFLHEAVAHYGLRGLLGVRFRPVLQQIAMTYGNKGLQEVANRYGLDLANAEDRMTAAEEKLAEMAETADRMGIVKRAVAAVRDWLRTHGFSLTWSDSDIKALLARARGYVERNNSQAASLFDGDRFSVIAPAPLARPELPEETRLQRGLRRFQDRYNRVGVLQNWLKEQGVQLSQLANAARGLATMNGKVADQLNRFMENQIQPLVKEAAKKKISLEDIEDYLLMQHAEEANEQMRKLHGDPNALAFGVTDQEAQQELAAYQARADFQDLKQLADRFQAFSTQTADMLESNGIISPEMRAAWDNAYQHYVPLRGGDQDTKQGTGKGLRVNGKQQRRSGHGLRDEHVIENIIKARERAIKTIEKNNVTLSIVQLIHEAADDRIGTVGKPELRRVFKNQKQYTVMYQGNPVAAFTNEADADRWVERDRKGTNRPITDYVLNISSDPTVAWQTSPMLGDNEINAYINGHQVRVQINDEVAAAALTHMGVEHLNSLLSIGKQINNYFSRAYTGYDPRFTIRNTFRDFTAGMVNLTGDYGAATAAKIAMNYPKAVREFMKARRDPARSTWVDRYRKQGGSTGAAWLSSIEQLGEDVEAMYQEQIGSIATYRTVYADEKAKGRSDMAAHAKALARSGVAGFHKIPVLGHFLKMIETMNAVSENAFRVSAFMTLVQEGRSEAEAGEAAKNSTINFDKKGELGPQMGALWLFFNPAIQGMHRSFFALTQSEHRRQAQALVGSMALAGFMVAELARGMGGGDDDEWDKIPRSIKNRHLVIRTGEKSQITIPLPYEYGSFVGIGYALNDMVHGKADQRTALNLASTILEGLAPLGNPVTDEGTVDPFAMMPTVAQLALAPSTNTNSFGSRIAPDKFKESLPDSQNMWRGTKGSIYDKIATGMNEATGGTKYSSGALDVSPEVLKYYTRTLLGGAATFVDQVVGLGIIAANGATPDVGEIPMVNVLARENNVRDTRRMFWEIASDASVAMEQFRAAKKGGDFQTAQDLKRKDAELLLVARLAESQAKLAKAKRDAIDAIRLDDSLSFSEKRAKTKELEEKEAQIYDRLIAAFNR